MGSLFLSPPDAKFRFSTGARVPEPRYRNFLIYTSSHNSMIIRVRYVYLVWPLVYRYRYRGVPVVKTLCMENQRLQ